MAGVNYTFIRGILHLRGAATITRLRPPAATRAFAMPGARALAAGAVARPISGLPLPVS
jgi:hypothetical protein